MTDLALERCASCAPGTPALAPAAAEALRAELGEEWRLDGGTLHRRFEFTSFAPAFAFATRIALLAEAQAHHPDLHVGWGYAEVDLTTHAAGGLTRNDFIMAARIEKIRA